MSVNRQAQLANLENQNPFRNLPYQQENKSETKVDTTPGNDVEKYKILFQKLQKLYESDPNQSKQIQPEDAIGILNCAFRYPDLCARLSKQYFIKTPSIIYKDLIGVNLFISYFKKAFVDLLSNFNLNKENNLIGEAKPSWTAYFSEHPDEMIVMNSWLEPFLQKLSDPKNSPHLIKQMKSRDIKEFLQTDLPEILRKHIEPAKSKKVAPDILAYIYESIGDPISLQVTKLKTALDKYVELVDKMSIDEKKSSQNINLSANREMAKNLRAKISETFDKIPNQNGLDKILDTVKESFYSENPKIDPVLLTLLYQSSVTEVTYFPQKSYADVQKDVSTPDLSAFKRKAFEQFDSLNSKRKNASEFEKEANAIDRYPKHRTHEKISFYLDKYKHADENKLTLEDKARCFNNFVAPFLERDAQNESLLELNMAGNDSLKKSLELFTKLDDQTKSDLANQLSLYSNFKAGIIDNPPKEFNQVKNLSRLQARHIAIELKLNISPNFSNASGHNVNTKNIKTLMLNNLQSLNELINNIYWVNFTDKIYNQSIKMPKPIFDAMTNFIQEFESKTGHDRYLERNKLITEFLNDENIKKFLAKEGKSLSSSLEGIKNKANTEKTYEDKDYGIIPVYKELIKNEPEEIKLSKQGLFSPSPTNRAAAQADKKQLENKEISADSASDDQRLKDSTLNSQQMRK